jgi:ribonucleoside-diphosphate reductase alpha chain
MFDIDNLPTHPEWLSEEAQQVLGKGYLMPGETPRDMWKRCALTAEKYLKRPGIGEDIMEAFWLGYLGGSTPVLSNFGTNRGLPVSCLETGTRVHTPDGFREIQDLEIGDLVLTHLGNWKPVLNKWSRQTTGDLYRLSVSNRGRYSLNVTGNHPVLTSEGWVKVEDLNPKSHKIVIEPITSVFRKRDRRKVFEFKIGSQRYNKGSSQLCKGAGCFKVKEIPNCYLDLDLAWWFGLWFAEGHTTDRGTIGISMGWDEEEHLDRWLKIAENKFGLKGTKDIYANNRGHEHAHAKIYNKYLQSFFDEEFGKGCKVKTIPDWFFEQPDETLKAFLEGFITGDGSLTYNGEIVNIGIANEKLAYQLWYISHLLGRFPSLTRNIATYHKDRNEEEDLNYKDHGCFWVKLPKSSPSGYGLSRSFKLEKQDRETTVWDIEVADDHSFVAQGVVVHNCYSHTISDDTNNIFSHLKEVAALSKHGGGVGSYFGELRPGGSPIKGGGKSGSIVDWMRLYDRTAATVSQGNTRRGSFALYLPIDHPDLMDALRSKDHTQGDPRNFIDSNLAVVIRDQWINEMMAGDKKKQEIFGEVLKARMMSGSPYLMFVDNANNQAPECFRKRNLKIVASNLCSEVMLPMDENHSFTCILSSINLAKYDEWKTWTGRNTSKTLPELGIYFLDAITEEFIHKAQRIPSMGRAVRFTRKARALGLGSMGLHALYQSRGLPFASQAARELNIEVHKLIDNLTLKASKDMAVEYGEPEWCEGHGVRHATRTAIAPTKTNSVICGAVSEGIEPIVANLFVAGNAKGTFVRRNPYLETHLASISKNTQDVWDSILDERGSVQHLKFLTEHVKNVFKTAREIEQSEIIKQASDRQQYICQGQSTNLFVDPESPAPYLLRLHLAAWKMGLKSLYYLKSSSLQVKKTRKVEQQKVALLVTKPDCPWCHKAKDLLSQQGYVIQEQDRSTIPDSDWPYTTVPQVWLNGVHVEGGYEGLEKLLVPDSEPEYQECLACQG